MMQYSLEKRMLRPESMPEIKRLQELRRLMLSGEALRSGGKVATYYQHMCPQSILLYMCPRTDAERRGATLGRQGRHL